MRILHKYILQELLGSFLLGVVLLAVVFGMGNMRRYGDEIAASGVHFGDVARLFMLVLPVVAQYLVPVAFLVSILLTFGRMSRDGEVLAAKACGLHLGTLTRPVLTLSLALTVGLFVCADRLSPWAVLRAKSMIADIVARAGTHLLQPGRWVKGIGGLQFYVERIWPDGTLDGIKIDYADEERPPVHVRADSGLMCDTAAGPVLILNDCELLAFGERSTTAIERAEVRLSDAAAALREAEKPFYQRDSATLGFRDLLRMAKHPEASAKRRAKARNEAGERVALPFACIAFALVGTSLGARALGGGRPYALGVAIPTVGVYYGLLLLGQTLSDVTDVSPLVTAWIPNIVVGGAGAVMTHRAAQR